MLFFELEGGEVDLVYCSIGVGGRVSWGGLGLGRRGGEEKGFLKEDLSFS